MHAFFRSHTNNYEVCSRVIDFHDHTSHFPYSINIMNVLAKAATILDRKETVETVNDTSCHGDDVTPSLTSDQGSPSDSCAGETPIVGKATQEQLGQFVVACIVVNYISAGYILLPRGKSKGVIPIA